MEIITKQTYPVLLVGSGDLTAGVAMCLLKAGHKLDVCTSNKAAFNRLFKRHVNAQEKNTSQYYNLNNVNVSDTIPSASDCKLAIALTSENKNIKQELIDKLETVLKKDAVIAINTESIPLNELSNKCANGKRLIGLNWTEPAHTTFFLEIIAGEENGDVADKICELAKAYWGKDPYIVQNTGIRSRLISAMAREASFLVDNGYASFDDIDRACRNDAGYYLPFSGNCRYMDLMGTNAYVMVMKELNPDLSKDQELPNFFKKILDNGGLGMENKKGFYTYSDESIANWKRTMEKFSYQVKDIIKKYPFNYNKEKISE
jgi:3-hydroxybutyryl-CoA dehydrogenase